VTTSARAEGLVVRRGELDDVGAAAEVKVVGWATAYDGLVPADLLAGFSSPQRWEPVLLRVASDPGAFYRRLGADVVGEHVAAWSDDVVETRLRVPLA
jgi:hypothetical protein